MSHLILALEEDHFFEATFLNWQKKNHFNRRWHSLSLLRPFTLSQHDERETNEFRSMTDQINSRRKGKIRSDFEQSGEKTEELREITGPHKYDQVSQPNRIVFLRSSPSYRSRLCFLCFFEPMFCAFSHSFAKKITNYPAFSCTSAAAALRCVCRQHSGSHNDGVTNSSTFRR